MTRNKGQVKTVFSCQKCGYQVPRWLGKCPECEGWNTFTEEIFAAGEIFTTDTVSRPERLSEISDDKALRVETGSPELDRVLGGGLVVGSAVLVGGEPGIGKSTLLLELADKLSQQAEEVLYVSGEESLSQIKLRADRLGIKESRFYLVNETKVEAIIHQAKELNARFLIVDSIQVISSKDLTQAPGSISQVKESAGRLVQFAKENNVTVIIVGHITKEGMLAGPKLLEHIVDAVLYFENDLIGSLRVLRSVKNRFGSTNEVGVFRMSETGIFSVVDPSREFLLERPAISPGSVAIPALEGRRVLMVELQALVKPSNFNIARYRASGVDLNRLLLIIAVLERHLKLKLSDQDIFISVAGGLRINETATDLTMAAAIVSSLRDKNIFDNCAVLGEVGLSGEIRGVAEPEMRIAEAQKLKFKKVVLPEVDLKRVKKKFNIELIGVADLAQAMSKIIR